MSDAVPHIDLGLTPGGEPVVIVGSAGEQARDMATMLRLAPGIALPAHAHDAALLVNHLAHGGDYRVIGDPQAFEAAYRAKLARENPSAPFRDGAPRLGDFGVPKFEEIKAPRFEGRSLVFYAEDRALGIPYRVTAAELTAAPDYVPVPMTPLPPVRHPAAGRQVSPVTPAERAARQVVKPGDLPE